MFLRCQIASVVLLASLAVPAAAELDEQLQILAPLVGERWVGHFRNVENGPQLIFHWEVILDGHAVRGLRLVPDREFRGESTYYWDERKQKVAYLSLTNNGYVSHGTVVVEDDRIIVVGDQSGPGGEQKVRAAFWVDVEGRLNNQLHTWENGNWEPAHTTLFERNR
ncbi:MAG: hypothetical protein JSW58_03630 [Candidatus Latescibacterota bacterium]|nr:MAG: hypothetical protein JSW58_03630 [Candidatus Latescibacterota bacterium]